MKMINKLTYSNGKIKNGFDSFKCDNETDMEVLCNIINSMFVEDEIKISRMETQLILIREALRIGELND